MTATVDVVQAVVRYGGITIPLLRVGGVGGSAEDRWRVGNGTSRFDRTVNGYDRAVAYATRTAEILEQARVLREVAQKNEDRDFLALHQEWDGVPS